MIQLIFSILALFIGVGMSPIVRKSPSWLSFFDAFVLISIVGLTVFHIIPHSIENAGIWGVAAVGAGLGIPTLLHHAQAHDHHHDHDHHRDNHHDDELEPDHREDDKIQKEHNKISKLKTILLTIAFIGIGIHTLLDGIGLSMSEHGDVGHLLGLGVLFHRLPVGFFLGILLVPMIGTKKTWGVAITMATATTLGYFLGHYALPHTGMVLLNVLQGLIAGTLLHVVFHNISVGGHDEFKYAKGAGALVGLAIFGLITWVFPVHAEDHLTPMQIWIDLMRDASSIWLILGLILLIGYKLSYKNNHIIQSITNKIKQFLDPQPRPVSAGGNPHIMAAASLVLMWALFDKSFALSWLAAAVIGIALAWLVFNKPSTCEICGRLGHCDVEQSFASWTMTSFGRITSLLLAASIIPFFLAPIRAYLMECPEFALNIIRSLFLALYLGFLVFIMHRHHGEHMDFLSVYSHIFLMFGILVLFNVGDNTLTRLTFTAFIALYAVLLLTFSESPLAIPHEETGKTPKFLKFSCCIMIPIVIIFAAAFMFSPQNDTQQSTISYTRGISPVIAQVEAEDEPHEHRHTHHHEPQAEDEHHESSVGILWHDHGDHPTWYDWFSRFSFVIFILTGLFWLFKLGPRQLFGAAEAHQHE